MNNLRIEQMTPEHSPPRARRALLPFHALSTACLCLIGAATPLAADGITAQPAFAMQPDAASRPATWAGTYAGGMLGYAAQGQDRVALQPAPPGPGNIGSLAPAGGQISAMIGHNWQNGQFVYGIEGGLTVGDTKDSLTSGANSASMKIKANADLKLRLGYAFNSDMLFLTGGISAARVDYRASDGGASNINDSFTRAGYTIGLGWQRALDDTWSLRGEYGYNLYNGKTLGSGGLSTVASPDFHAVRFGVNRRF